MSECLRKDDCPCTNTSCERHGRCCACVAAHTGPGKSLPDCLKGNLEPAE